MRHGQSWRTNTLSMMILCLRLFAALDRTSTTIALGTSAYTSSSSYVHSNHVLCRIRHVCSSTSTPFHRYTTHRSDESQHIVDNHDDKWNILPKMEFESFDQKGNWMIMDWNINRLQQQQASPVERVVIRDRMIHMKRDDLLRLHQSHVSGNKARKLWGLNQLSVDSFPKAIVSFGGPQSNAMVALAAIVNAKNIEYSSSSSTTATNRRTNREDSLQSTIPLPRIIHDTSMANDMDVFIPDNLSELSFFHDDEDNEDKKRFLEKKIIKNNKSFQHENVHNKQSLLDSTAIGIHTQEEEADDDEKTQLAQKDKGGGVIGKEEDEPFFSKQQRKTKHFRFIYYTKKLPRYLRKQPNGNLLRALSLGMELIELSSMEYGQMFHMDDDHHENHSYRSTFYPSSSKIQPPIPGQSLWVCYKKKDIYIYVFMHTYIY